MSLRSFHRNRINRRCRTLKVESLENRVYLSGEPIASLPQPDPLPDAIVAFSLSSNTVSPVSNANTTAAVQDLAEKTEAAAGFERFQSLQEIKDYLLADAVARYQDQFGKEALWCVGFYEPVFPNIDNGIFVTRDTALDSIVALASVSYSDTNTQVAGVDEADLMETDGDYLYMLSNDELVIIDVRSVDEPAIASRLDLNREISSMYLSGDRLTLISQSTNPEITLLDIADRTAPKVVQKTSFDGYLIDSRAIGDRVYLVLSHYSSLPGPNIVHLDGTPVEDDTPHSNAQYRYETEQEYRTRMEDYLNEHALPRFTSVDADGQEIAGGFISNPNAVYKPDGSDHCCNWTTVAVIDMSSNQPGPADAVSLTGNISQVYASADNLYLLGSVYESANSMDLFNFSTTEHTLIRKIDLVNEHGKLEQVAKGKVVGRVLDQFSVDEYRGFFRIATTEGWNTTAKNQLFVLSQDGQELKIIGSVTGLAPGENIYSARFLGDQAFVVTFHQVDPLFAIDLSDPTAPNVRGELKIPGFSNYLHSIDGGLLIGIGRDADPSGFYQNPQISLFDVNDLANPQLLGQFIIETGRTGGMNLFNDHHVIAYYPKSQILTVSVPDAHESGTDSWYSVNDLYVFQIDTSGASADLELLGKIEHEDSVLRSVQIDDRLISISHGSIEVHDLMHPDVVLATLVINEINAPLPMRPVSTPLQPVIMPWTGGPMEISSGPPQPDLDPTIPASPQDNQQVPPKVDDSRQTLQTPSTRESSTTQIVNPGRERDLQFLGALMSAVYSDHTAVSSTTRDRSDGEDWWFRDRRRVVDLPLSAAKRTVDTTPEGRQNIGFRWFSDALVRE